MLYNIKFTIFVKTKGMTQFDIIGALRTYCNANNIKFIWHYDEFYANINSVQEHDASYILVADILATPDFVNSKVAEINYSGLIMLGKKFDSDGLSASLDEEVLQKYDRRLQELQSSLVTIMSNFACDNELQLSFTEISFLINAFDSNIDFVVCNPVTLMQ